jgi:hypothetical protein
MGSLAPENRWCPKQATQTTLTISAPKTDIDMAIGHVGIGLLIAASNGVVAAYVRMDGWMDGN